MGKLNFHRTVVIKDLNITPTGTYGYGILLTNNADSNTIIGCTIDNGTTNSSSGLGGILMSGSSTSATSTGSDCDGNQILNNTTIGGYYGITAMGSTTTSIYNNVIKGNTVKDFYYYGMYIYGYVNGMIDSNDVSRPNRTSTSSFYGIYTTTGTANTNITRNKLHDAFGSNKTYTGSAYCLYTTADATLGSENIVANNIIYNIEFLGTIYAIYNGGGDYTKYLHNTISLDDTTSTATSVTRAFYNSTTTSGLTIENNIFSVRRGGTGTKTLLYFNSTSSTIKCDHNDLLMDAASGSTNVIGYYSGNQTTLSNWQSATTYDSNSIDLSPQFTQPYTGDLTPQNILVDDLGVPVGISTDINGKPRSATSPDLGAIEFHIDPPCLAPAGLNETNITANTAKVLWNMPGFGASYEYVVSTSSSFPTGAGTPTNDTFANLTGLSKSTTYYYFVRTVCHGITTATYYSPYVRDSFTTCTPPPATLAPSSSTLCQGESVTLQGNTGTGLSYKFLKNNVLIPGANADNYTTSTAGSYQIIVSNSQCGDTSAVATVVVNPLPTAGLTATGSTMVCQGDTVFLNANTGTGLSYQYLKNNLIVLGATSVNYNALSSGIYRVKVTNSNGCSDTSLGISVTVAPLPNATLTPVGSTSICQGDSVQLNANVLPSLTYKYRKNNVVISGATGSSIKVGDAGSYKVEITNSLGCKDTSLSVVVSVNPLPTASLTAAGTTTICIGQSVLLNANTGAGLSYQFLRNGMLITGATSSNYSATSSGNYRVEVTNASGCKDTSASVSLSVSPLPTASLTAAASTTICANDSVALNANTGAGLTYQYSYNNSIITGANASTYFAKLAGAYKVKVTNAGGCTDSSTAVVISVNALPLASIGASSPTTFCQGDSVKLQANTGTGLSYQFARNNSPIFGANTQSYTAFVAGPYTVNVTDANGCKNTSAPFTISVIPLPVANISAAGPRSFCAGESVKLYIQKTSGYQYQWLQNGGAITGATDTSIVATATANFSLKVTNTQGCTATSVPVNVLVNPFPVVTLSPSGSASYCEFDSIILSASSTTANAFRWMRADSLISGAFARTYTAKQPGKYSIVGYNSAGCADTSEYVTVVENPAPLPIITFDGTKLSTTVLYASYQWYLDGTAIPSGSTPAITPTHNGIYSVSVTDSVGCSNRSTAYNLNNLSTSLNGLSRTVEIFPNPTSGILYIKAGIHVSISIYTMDGRLMMPATNATQIDLKDLPAAVYNLIIRDSEGHLLGHERLVKEN